MTADERRLTYTERQQQKQIQAEQARRAQYRETAQRLAEMSDEDLIASAPGFPGPHHEMEMQRRLRNSVERLTAELVTSRAAAAEDARHQAEISAQLKASIEALAAEVVTSRKSADRLALRVVRASWVLVALTVALVALTVVLAVGG